MGKDRGRRRRKGRRTEESVMDRVSEMSWLIDFSVAAHPVMCPLTFSILKYPTFLTVWSFFDIAH